MTYCQPPHSFTVSGASGSTVFLEANTQPADLGGRPAVVSGTVALAAGSIVYLVVGQTAGLTLQPSLAGQYGGGGGGSYVFLNDLATPLFVAGVSHKLMHPASPCTCVSHQHAPLHSEQHVEVPRGVLTG